MQIIRLQAYVVAFVIGCVTGCEKTSKPSGVAKIEPAHVDHHVDENDLNTITLTPLAEERLGIQLAEVQLSKVRQKRTLGGDVTLPPGQTIIVTAPIAGTLEPPADAEVTKPGKRLSAGQAIFRFKPLLSAERDVLTPSERVTMAQTKANVATTQLEARRQVESANVELEAAEIAYDRASQLYNSKAGSKRALDEADTQRQLAIEAKQTAESRYKFLSSINLDEEAGELESRDIESPVDGLLQGLDAAPGETVSAGQVLFTVIRTDRVWIRVPIYVGQWREIDTETPAIVTEFGAPPDAATRSAEYVSAPPSADPNTITVNIFYTLDNTDGRLYPGQKISVALPLKKVSDSLTVPFKAVLYDVHGGAWVYEQTTEHVYARRRVSVQHIDGESAVLGDGPDPGTRVVTDGAAELFGTEFGVGH